MVISVLKGIPRLPEWRMAEPVDFELAAGEHIAIAGPNASGKSMLVDIITGAHPLMDGRVEYDFNEGCACNESPRSNLASDSIKYISFRDSYGGDGDRIYYLQQRWNMTEEDDADAPVVGNILEAISLQTGDDTNIEERRAMLEHLYDIFELRPLLDKPLVCLSSGELRKFVLCRTLMSAPRVLIIDNPFIGLDKTTRLQVREVMEALVSQCSLQLILVLAKDEEIPHFITHVVPVRKMVVGAKVSREAYLEASASFTLPPHSSSSCVCNEIMQLHNGTDGRQSQEVVQLHKVTIRYGDRIILKDLDWTVMQGERWALSGQNGAGKSTLLSIICADNPQSYACDVSLFGRKRGSGESIWDIKRHIGYVSPEMHRAYHRDIPALRIVASGLKDSIGLHIKPTPEEYDSCRMWMRFMGIEHLVERSFLKMSSGEQRLVLLARAFVKDPSLLILDEPLHGLDSERSKQVKALIEAFCRRPNKTLIMVTHYEEELPSCITRRLHLVRNI